MFNLTSSAPKSWQTVSRQADRVNAEQTYSTYHAEPVPSIQELGVVLRERREALGASLAEVEAATRIRQKYLAALESDDWHLLPGEIVGRGFLRNYATYLGLDQTELVERRRAVADPSMTSTLAGTSAASPLPPERHVDYRPKDVALKDEPEGIQQREIRTGPILTVLGLFGALFFAWWIMSSFGSQIGNGVAASINSIQTRVATTPQTVATSTSGGTVGTDNFAPPAVSDVDNLAPVAGNNSGESSIFSGENAPQSIQTPAPESNPGIVIAATVTPTTEAPQRLLIPTDTPAVGESQTGNVPLNDAPIVAAPPTEAPLVEAAPANAETVNSADVAPTPTATAVPPTPTETSIPEPTATFTPAPPVVVAPACPDPRSAISSPGVNQTLAGAVTVMGTATHEAFQYYKLEYALGAGATEGFFYFAGAENSVEGGVLGTFNTPSLPNGDYTLQITVVDLSANYPPPCRVTVTIAN